MLLQLLFIVGLALVHLFAGKLNYLDSLSRSAWLSFAGGISVAYVFIHVFPLLERAHRAFGEHGPLLLIEYNAYVVALIGLSAFYGLERLAKRHAPPAALARERGRLPTFGQTGVFWLHIGSFALYNALIGYVLVYRENTLPDILFFFLAMGFHFLVNDYGLLQHHRHAYQRGRWILAASVVAGWVTGQAMEVTEAVVGALYAFVAGGLVLNVLKEELPEERNSRYWPFASGVALCAALLLLA